MGAEAVERDQRAMAARLAHHTERPAGACEAVQVRIAGACRLQIDPGRLRGAGWTVFLLIRRDAPVDATAPGPVGQDGGMHGAVEAVDAEVLALTFVADMPPCCLLAATEIGDLGVDVAHAPAPTVWKADLVGKKPLIVADDLAVADVRHGSASS